MNYSKVVAIISISQDVLEKVERRLQELQVPGICVTKVKGYGEYANFYSRDWMTTHTKGGDLHPGRARRAYRSGHRGGRPHRAFRRRYGGDPTGRQGVPDPPQGRGATGRNMTGDG